MKKYIILGLLCLTLLAGSAGAETSIADQIAAIEKQILALQEQIKVLRQQERGNFCYTFNHNFSPTSGDLDWPKLSTVLQYEGLGSVTAFQAKYGIPATGFVGPLTRGRLNQLYGCAPVTKNITVLTPNGGERWVANSVQDITWSQNDLCLSNIVSCGLPKVDLYLDGEPSPNPSCLTNQPCLQSLWTPNYTLDKNIGPGAYHWIVATDVNDEPIPSGLYKVRVCEAGSITNCDSSDSFFTILSPASTQ